MKIQGTGDWQADNLTRVLVGMSALFALLTVVGILAFGRALPLVELPWFVVTTQAFTALSAFTLALLCFGRYRALGGPWTFWAGLAFLTNSIFGIFYLLSWPELIDGRGLIGRLPGTAAWFRQLSEWALGLLVIAAVARGPARLSTPRRFSLYTAAIAAAVAIGSLSLAFEDTLPTITVGNRYTDTGLISYAFLSILLTYCSVILIRRYLKLCDRILGYLAMFSLMTAFGLVFVIIGGDRYDFWWYASRFIWISAYLVVLFGLLQEGYVLFGSERKRAEYLAALNEIVQALSTVKTLGEACSRAVDIAATILDVKVANLFLRQGANGPPILISSHGIGEQMVDKVALHSVDDRSLIGLAIASGKAQFATRLQAPSLTADYVRAMGISVLAAVPVMVKGEAVGAICIGRDRDEGFTEEDVNLLSAVADQIGIAVENTQLWEQLRSANEQLTVATIMTKNLAESEEQRAEELNALIDSIAEGVTIVDAAGRISRINRTGQEIWGVAESAEVLGKAADTRKLDLRQTDLRPLPDDQWPIMRALRGETFAEQEVVYVRPDGRNYDLLFSGSAIRDESGKMVLAINTYRDITQIRDLERDQEAFISIVAHDLRGAMTSIRGYSELLMRISERERISDQVSRGLMAIFSSSKRMERMISDLLDASRIEAHKLTLTKESLDLTGLVGEVIQQSEGTLDGRTIDLQIHGVIPAVAADPDRVGQILTNLISNAVKYSYPETKITVEIEARQNQVMVSVTNLGQGVPPEERDALFARFYRMRRAQLERVSGLGLGLYITKGLVEAHGGRIWVESQPGEYATFRFTLPV